ncbi:MAG: DUF4830 domain-containing protein [Ruminococcaceae bacterium]|nr:DUF4830 domain-containing protein [Oscillospiraceae bacterium]
MTVRTLAFFGINLLFFAYDAVKTKREEQNMFICAVKATTLRFVGILVLSVTVLVGMTVFYTAEEPVLSGTDVRYDGMYTETDRRDFLSSLGYKATGDAKSTVEYTLPPTLDAVLLGYNQLQREQGFDLEKYTGKTLTRYTYELASEDGKEKEYATLLVYRDRIVGADLTGENGKNVKPLL